MPRRPPELLKKSGAAPPSWCGPLSLANITSVRRSIPSARSRSTIAPMSRSIRTIIAAKAAFGVGCER